MEPKFAHYATQFVKINSIQIQILKLNILVKIHAPAQIIYV